MNRLDLFDGVIRGPLSEDEMLESVLNEGCWRCDGELVAVTKRHVMCTRCGVHVEWHPRTECCPR